jgi:hypothetical protein
MCGTGTGTYFLLVLYDNCYIGNSAYFFPPSLNLFTTSTSTVHIPGHTTFMASVRIRNFGSGSYCDHQCCGAGATRCGNILVELEQYRDAAPAALALCDVIHGYFSKNDKLNNCFFQCFGDASFLCGSGSG